MIDARLTNALVDARRDDPEFGYRFLADVGHAVGERRVWHIGRQQRLWSTATRTDSASSGKRTGLAVHDDLVQCDSNAARLDAVYVADINEHHRRQALLLSDWSTLALRSPILRLWRGRSQCQPTV